MVIGFLFGPEVLAGALAGALAVGATLSLLMANGGGAWDNAKKFIEKGGLPGHKKGSDAHKAAVVGDTVGDGTRARRGCTPGGRSGAARGRKTSAGASTSSSCRTPSCRTSPTRAFTPR